MICRDGQCIQQPLSWASTRMSIKLCRKLCSKAHQLTSVWQLLKKLDSCQLAKMTCDEVVSGAPHTFQQLARCLLCLCYKRVEACAYNCVLASKVVFGPNQRSTFGSLVPIPQLVIAGIQFELLCTHSLRYSGICLSPNPKSNFWLQSKICRS